MCRVKCFCGRGSGASERLETKKGEFVPGKEKRESGAVEDAWREAHMSFRPALLQELSVACLFS